MHEHMVTNSGWLRVRVCWCSLVERPFMRFKPEWPSLLSCLLAGDGAAWWCYRLVYAHLITTTLVARHSRNAAATVP
jgi:hypothetical protein